VDKDDLNLLMGTILQRQLPSGYQCSSNGVKVDMLAGGKYQGTSTAPADSAGLLRVGARNSIE